MTNRKGQRSKARIHDDGDADEWNNTQHGGPSKENCANAEERSRLKPGDLSWVPLCKPGDFNSWRFHFEMGAQTYLSVRVFDNPRERDGIYNLALLKATENNYEMAQKLRRILKRNIYAEAAIERLAKVYDKNRASKRKDAYKKLMTFQRGSMTLTKALDIVEDRLLDCENTGFNPENDTLAMLYYNLLRDGLETTQYRILNRLEPNAPSEEDDLGPADRVLRIVELIAEDIEGHSDNKQHDATKPVFGGVAEGSKGRRTWNCNRCGDKQCVSLKTKKKDDCPAALPPEHPNASIARN